MSVTPTVPVVRDRRALRSPDPATLPPRTLARLQDLILAHAADMLSGPARLASFLRAGLLNSDGTTTATSPDHTTTLHSHGPSKATAA